MILFNASSRYVLKLQPRVIEMANELLNPSKQGQSKVKFLKDVELMRLLQSLMFYSNEANVRDSETVI